MATILRSFDWTKTSKNKDARSKVYPWETWLDGRIWRLEAGEDFNGPPGSLERVIRTTANRRGVRVRVRVQDDGSIVLQQHADTDMTRRRTKSPSKAEIEARRQQAALKAARAESKALREARKAVDGQVLVPAATNGHKPAPAPVKRIKRRSIANRHVLV